MQVIDVVVDELPKSCFTCYFAQAIRKDDGKISTNYYCVPAYITASSKKQEAICNMKTRPDWCPLVTIEDFGKTNGALRTESEERMIQSGDKVVMYYYDDEKRPKYDIVEILRTPRGEGDLWQVKTQSGDIHAINPYSPDFIRFVKESEEE